MERFGCRKTSITAVSSRTSALSTGVCPTHVMICSIGVEMLTYLALQLTCLIGFVALSVFAKNIEMLLVGQIFCG